MAGETVRIAEIAERLSNEVFKFFRWKSLPQGLMNQNFPCENKELHVVIKEKLLTNLKAELEEKVIKAVKAHTPKEQIELLKEENNAIIERFKETKKDSLEKTHPVDAVFFYEDPYHKVNIYFNCDLKSYQESSITPSSIRTAINSLAETIHCASESETWNTRYNRNYSGEVRGLLFLLNHDGEYNNNIKNYFYNQKIDTDEQTVHIENLQLQPNQFIHIIDPSTIRYLSMIKNDVAVLGSEGRFPVENRDWYFYYPDLKLHRPSIDTSRSPATIEMLLGPFLIIKHKNFKKVNTDDEFVREGYLIYYKLEGKSKEEFLFFLDTLSGYQIFKESPIIQIRFINENMSAQIEENFLNAIQEYIQDWNLNEQSARVFNEISFSIVNISISRFLTMPILYREL